MALFKFVIAGLVFGLAAMLAACSGLGTTAPTAPIQSVASKAIPTVTANAQWKPQFQSFDGVEMALVPPGCFMLGMDNPPSGRDNEKPATNICFDKPFWLDKTEVTQAQFKRLGGAAASSPYFPGDNHPVDRVTWVEARDFCAKTGGRLPTEAEWEYAARGPDNLTYPWGNAFDGSKIVYDHTSDFHTADVGSRPAGASWVGALDMIGNVNELTSSLLEPYPYNPADGRESASNTDGLRVSRGGNWDDGEPYQRAAVRVGGVLSADGFGHNGIRCARSY